jgi:hypothetical protein
MRKRLDCRVVAALSGLVLVVLGGGCSDSGTPVPPAPAPSALPTRVAAAGCPVEDAAACARIAEGANALAAGDTAALRALSIVETFDCDDTPADVVPACKPGVVLSGYGRFAVDTRISVVPPGEYESFFGGLLGRVDPAYTDERGTGALAVMGVGTCGPADPTRRSYHLAFTAGLRGEGAPERWLGSLEFVMRDGRWSVGLVYVDTESAWRKEHRDPYRGIACGNVRAWR